MVALPEVSAPGERGIRDMGAVHMAGAACRARDISKHVLREHAEPAVLAEPPV